MTKKTLLILNSLILAGYLAISPAFAEEYEQVCKKMDEKINGVGQEFSIYGEVNTTFAFNDIACGMIWLRELCAMELVSFNATAKVFDFVSLAEIPLDQAFFVIGAGIQTPLHSDLIAFRNEKDAKDFIAAQGRGKIVSYSQLQETRF